MERSRQVGHPRRRLVPLVATVAIILVASACETTTIGQVGALRTQAAVAGLTTSRALSDAARAHSDAMCAAGAVTPAADPAAAYVEVAGATAIHELVGSAELDPSISDWGVRNTTAADAVFAAWSTDPELVDARWQSIGVGEVECGDGRLYSTMVLRDDPPGLGQPADTSGIALVGTTTQDGWRFDRYRNAKAPCAIGGFQTFLIGTKVGSSATATRPLWVRMRGGGVGWFDDDGTPLPTAGVKSEESFATQLGFDSPGLMASAKAAPEGFRVLIVSMCSHDIYAGNDNYDPYDPNTYDGGQTRPTTGLTATKAAIQFTMAAYPTDDYVLHGTSAGGVGVLHVAWALQLQGLAPAAAISDSGVLNQAWQLYVAQNGIPGSVGCEKATEERGFGVLGRIDRAIGDPANQPDLLVADHRLTVPILHVWNHNDQNQCGAYPIPCPLRDGSTPTMSAADCNHEPLRLAIASLGPSSRSANMGVCVEGGDTTTPCDRHVVTAAAHGVNSDPSSPADHQAAILDWVRLRLADD